MRLIDDSAIRARLIRRARALHAAPRVPVTYSQHVESDALLNDLKHHPHAFVLAAVMDRQIKFEKAWLIPYRISERIGGFGMKRLRKLSLKDVEKHMTKPDKLHRFIPTMAKCFHAAIQRIDDRYDGDASRIWSGKPSSAAVVYRFLEFKGVGPKIASMAVNLLVRDFKIPLGDYYSIDISADVHVRRVFARLGLTEPNPSPEQVIYRARALNPEFPGLIDPIVFNLGRDICHPRKPECGKCFLAELCHSERSRARR